MLKGDELLNKMKTKSTKNDVLSKEEKENSERIFRENSMAAFDDKINKVRVEACFKHASMLPKWISDGKCNSQNFEAYDYSNFGMGIVAGSIYPDENSDEYCLEIFGLNSESEKMNRKVDEEAVTVTYAKMFGDEGRLSEYLLKGKILSRENIKDMAKTGNLYSFTGMTDENGKYFEKTGVVLSREIADKDRNVEILASSINTTLQRFQIEKEKALSEKFFDGKDPNGTYEMPNEEYVIPQNSGLEE